MKKEKFTADEHPLLHNEKENVCISVIVPTHRLSPGRRTDPLQLVKAIRQAKEPVFLQKMNWVI